MTSVIQALESIDLSKLTVHLDAANGTVSGSVTLKGINPQDLLGDLGGVLALVQNGLPSKPEDIAAAVTAGLGELDKVLELPDLSRIAQALAGLEQLVEIMTNAANMIGPDPAVLVDQLLQQFGGEFGSVVKIIEEFAGRITDVIPTELPPALEAPVKAMEALAHGTPSDAASLVRVLGPIMIGVDFEALAAPGDRLRQFLVQVEGAGGDLGALRTQTLALTAELNAVTAMMVAPDADLSAIQSQLAQIQGKVQAWLAPVQAGLSRLAADLGSLHPGALATDLVARLDPLLALVPEATHHLQEVVVTPLREVVEQIEALDGAGLRALFADAQKRMLGAAATLGLDQAALAIEELFDVIIDQIDRVPIKRVRDELLGYLVALDGKIRGFLGFSLPGELAEKLATLEHAIENVDLSAITGRVAELKQHIQDAVDQFPIAAIKEELSKVVGAITDVIKSFTPALQTVADQLDQLAAEISAIDIHAAGQASIDVLSGIREKVEELLSSDDIPDAAKSVIGVAAEQLKQINVSASVTAPFHEALAKIDVGVILAPVEAGMGKVREVLQKVTPQALIDELDGPFEALLEELAKFKPEKLLGGISKAFDDLMSLLQNADPRALVAPIEAEFQKLVQKLRDAIDPAPLFKPLNDAYQKILSLVDVVDLGKLLKTLMSKLGNLPEQMTGAAKGAIAAKAAGAVPLTEDGLGGFKFGDILRPVAMLLRDVRQKVLGFAESLLGEALELLLAPLSLLKRLADPASGVAAEIAGAVAARRGLVDPFASRGPVAELRAALHLLSDTASGLSFDARLQVGDAVAAVQIDAHIGGLAAASAAVDDALGRMQAASAPPELGLVLRRFSGAMTAPTTAALLGADPSAGVLQRIGALFDAIDPTPLADELDSLGDRVLAKLDALKEDLIKGFLDLLYGLLKTLMPITPYGFAEMLTVGMQRVKGQLAVLDPSVFEDEIRHILDGVLSGLNRFSPAAMAEELGKLFDAVLAKLGTLNPATLLGDLDPVAQVIAKLEELRPSVVLAPMVAETQDLKQALDQIADFKLGAAVIEAAVKLRAELDLIVEEVQQQIDKLLDDLGAAGGQGGASADISVSASGG
jgi:hypothetical protein